jgi:hypothetical protein
MQMDGTNSATVWMNQLTHPGFPSTGIEASRCSSSVGGGWWVVDASTDEVQHPHEV